MSHPRRFNRAMKLPLSGDARACREASAQFACGFGQQRVVAAESCGAWAINCRARTGLRPIGAQRQGQAVAANGLAGASCQARFARCERGTLASPLRNWARLRSASSRASRSPPRSRRFSRAAGAAASPGHRAPDLPRSAQQPAAGIACKILRDQHWHLARRSGLLQGNAERRPADR